MQTLKFGKDIINYSWLMLIGSMRSMIIVSIGPWLLAFSVRCSEYLCSATKNSLVQKRISALSYKNVTWHCHVRSGRWGDLTEDVDYNEQLQEVPGWVFFSWKSQTVSSFWMGKKFVSIGLYPHVPFLSIYSGFLHVFSHPKPISEHVEKSTISMDRNGSFSIWEDHWTGNFSGVCHVGADTGAFAEK
jgi:hypothetical protein